MSSNIYEERNEEFPFYVCVIRRLFVTLGPKVFVLHDWNNLGEQDSTIMLRGPI